MGRLKEPSRPVCRSARHAGDFCAACADNRMALAYRCAKLCLSVVIGHQTVCAVVVTRCCSILSISMRISMTSLMVLFAVCRLGGVLCRFPPPVRPRSRLCCGDC